jgi:hypothetical protein
MIPGARLRPPLRLLRVEVDDVAHDTGWVDAKMFLARHPHNEDAEISFVSLPKMIAGANCHRATRRARDHPYLAQNCQMVISEQLTGVLIPVV